MLLILAGVTIAALSGPNGILTNATKAKEDNAKAQVIEEARVDILAKQTEKMGESPTSEELEQILTPKYGTLSNEENILDRTLTTKDGYSIKIRDIWNGTLSGQKAEVTPVYAYLCDTDGNGAGETLVLSSTETINGYTIIKNYGDNEAYQTDENNAEDSYGNIYYYPIWKNETTLITNVIIYDKIVPTITDRWFNNCSNLEKIENIINLDTSNVKTMICMFNGCKKLTNLNLSSFNTSSVIDFTSMFNSCSALTNLNISNFDTKNASKINAMFYNCSSLTNLNLTSFDTTNVTSMPTMFYNCSSLTSLDLSSFNTDNVTDITMLFYNCKNLNTIIVNSGWNTEKATGAYVFENCISLIGGAGTKYDASHADKEYAHIDEGESNPGYFTLKI